MRTVLFCLVFLIPAGCISAQEISADSAYHRLIDEIIKTGEGENAAPLFSELEFFKDNPVNINAAPLSELLSVPFMDFNSASEIINYRKKEGLILSKAELVEKEVLSPGILRKLRPFITTGLYAGDKQEELPSSGRLAVRLRDYTSLNTSLNSYPGNLHNTYIRINASADENISFGLQAEKDAGEKNYADANSGYIRYRQEVYTLLAGDYNLSFGSGIALSSGFSPVKSPDIGITATRTSFGMRPHYGTSEDLFFRGAAFSFQSEKSALIGFYSYRTYDAITDTNKGFVRSFDMSGIHITPAQTARKDNSIERTFGIMTGSSITDKFFIAGLLMKKIYTPSVLYAETMRDRQLIASLTVNYSLSAGHLNAEAGSDGYGKSIFANAMFIPRQHTRLTISFRDYSPRFFSLQGAPYREYSGAGEKGLLVSLERTRGIFAFGGYADFYSADNLTAPGGRQDRGYEAALYVRRSSFASLNSLIRFKLKHYDTFESYYDYTAANPFYALRDVSKDAWSVKWDNTYESSENFRLLHRTEVQFYSSSSNNNLKKSVLLMLDAKYMFRKESFIQGRIYLAGAESGQSALYEGESDFPGSYRLLVFTQATVRTMLTASMLLAPEMHLGINYISQIYDSPYTPGIKGIRVQLDYSR